MVNFEESGPVVEVAGTTSSDQSSTILLSNCTFSVNDGGVRSASGANAAAGNARFSAASATAPATTSTVSSSAPVGSPDRSRSSLTSAPACDSTLTTPRVATPPASDTFSAAAVSAPPLAAVTVSENRTTATLSDSTSSSNVGRTFSTRKTLCDPPTAALPARSLSIAASPTTATVTSSPPSAIPITSRSISRTRLSTSVPVGVPSVAAPPATEIETTLSRSTFFHSTSSENVTATPLPAVSDSTHDGRTFSISAAVWAEPSAVLPVASTMRAPLLATATDSVSEPSGTPLRPRVSVCTIEATPPATFVHTSPSGHV